METLKFESEVYNMSMKKIYLTGSRGTSKYGHKFTVVDDEDYEELIQYDWLYTPTGGYAIRWFTSKDGKWRSIGMHRHLMQTPEGLFTDHKNNDKLDNRRSNLRITDKNGNEQNKGKRASWGGTPCSSQYIGVYYDKDPNTKRRKRWSAYVRVDNKRKYLGRFMTELEAAQAYDSAAKELHGEFAKVNF